MTSVVNGTSRNLSTHYECGPRETPANQGRSEVNFKSSSYNTKQRTCVYCEKSDHKSIECSSVTKPGERRQILQRKRLSFNCTGQGTEARSVKVDQNVESVMESTIPQFAKNHPEKT